MPASIQRLILDNYGLLRKYAGKYAKGDDDLFFDLITFAIDALIRAYQSFDASKGFKWSTYAGVSIENACRTYMRTKYVKYDFDNSDDVPERRYNVDYTDEYLKDKILQYIEKSNPRRVESLLSMYTTHETLTEIARRRGVCVNTVRNEAIEMLEEIRSAVL